jgi:chorismate mutase
MRQFEERLQTLRDRVDEIDRTILKLLADRFTVTDEIGKVKSEYSVPVLQEDRWNSLLRNLVGRAENIGLNPRLITQIYELIHEESVAAQSRRKN